MDLAGANRAMAPYLEKLALWRGYESELETLVIYAVGIALYTMLVFAFYQNVSRVEAFRSRGEKPRWRRALEDLLLFPVMSMLYFAVLAASLFLLAKAQQGTYQILLLSMAVVLSVRVTAILSEEMSADLAKLLPLGLLGVLLVDPGALTLGAAWGRLLETPAQLPVLARFFLLFVFSEVALRGGRAALRAGLKAWRARRSRRVEVKAPEPAAPAQDQAPLT